jgi:release factor glutamine methyltransferase
MHDWIGLPSSSVRRRAGARVMPPNIARIKDTCFHGEVYEPAEVRSRVYPRIIPRPPPPPVVAFDDPAIILPPSRARADIHPPHPPAVALCPLQDSFLLVDALAAEWDTTFRTRPPRVAVEVGCGTGYVIASAALLASASGIVPGDAVPGDGGDGEIDRVQNAAAAAAAFAYYATDINPDALATTRATLRNHGIADERVELTRGDLLGPLRERLRGKIDLLLFNPPYVLTPSEEVRACVEP